MQTIVFNPFVVVRDIAKIQLKDYKNLKNWQSI